MDEEKNEQIVFSGNGPSIQDTNDITSAELISDPFANTAIEEVTPNDFTAENIGFNPAPQNEVAGLSPKLKSYLVIGGAALVTLLLSIIILAIFVRSRGTASQVKENVTLKYAVLWETEDVYAPIIDQYQKENPHVKIEVDITNTIKTPQSESSKYQQKLISRISEGSGPDIYRFHNTWVPVLVSAKVLAPISKNVMKNQEFESLYYSVIERDLKVGDSYYGIPLMIDGLVLLYNKQLLQNAGVEVPQTWEELQKASAAVTVSTEDNELTIAGVSLGSANNIEHYADIFGFMLIQNGASLAKLSGSESVAALSAYRSFAMGKNAVWSENLPNNIALFLDKKLAMLLAPSWQVSSILAIDKDFPLGVAPPPRLAGGKSLSIANYWVEGVSAKISTTKQTEAFKFLKYLGNQENLTKMYAIQASKRAMPEAYPIESMRNLLLGNSQNNFTEAIAEIAPNLVSLSTINRTFDSSLNDTINAYLANAIEKTIAGVSYEQALLEAEKGVNSELKKYNIQATVIDK